METLASWKRDILSSHLKAGLYYIELVNVSIPGDAFCLNHRSVRPETQLSQICIATQTETNILEKWTKNAVWRSDIKTVEDWKLEVGSPVQKSEVGEAHIEEWKKIC